jgi:hypothetical protein
MGAYWIFGDESGNLDFSTRGTHWFATGTLTMSDGAKNALEQSLNDLSLHFSRSEMVHDGIFHASEDRQAVRDKVFPLLAGSDSRGDVTFYEKNKANPVIRQTGKDFYGWTWNRHFQYLLRKVGRRGDHVTVVLSDIGTKKERTAFVDAVQAAVSHEEGQRLSVELLVRKNSADRCLQAADYLVWAAFRAQEQGDMRSLDQIKDIVKSRFDMFATGATRYY